MASAEPRRRSQAERREDTRRALLASADRAFSRYGFHAASVEEIAEDAGFSKGAVYGRFGGKDDLFLAVLEDRFERRLALASIKDMDGAGTAERLEALAAAHRRAVGEDPEWTVAWVEFAAHATRDPETSRRLRVLNARLRKRTEKRMAEFADVDARAASYLTTVALVYGSGVSIERMLDPESTPEDHLARLARALARDA